MILKGSDIKIIVTPDKQAGTQSGNSRAKSLLLNTLKVRLYY